MREFLATYPFVRQENSLKIERSLENEGVLNQMADIFI